MAYRWAVVMVCFKHHTQRSTEQIKKITKNKKKERKIIKNQLQQKKKKINQTYVN